MCKKHVNFNKAVSGLFVFLIVISVSIVNAAALQQENVTLFHSKANKLAVNESKDEELIRLKVDGLASGACARLVQSALLDVNGVKDAEVSHMEGKALVQVEKGKVKIDELIEAVEKAGYSASEN
ncbi:MAG: cation transporter [Candidatus Brocadiaceae bacterium]|nr:cation transporter [Candidatus Brocadiaceae bacterium]